MGPTHNNQNGPGAPKSGGSVKIITPDNFHFRKTRMLTLWHLSLNFSLINDGILRKIN